MKYLEQLRDPRWQRRRLEIMQAANFKCEEGCNDHTPLNVHHSAYLKKLPVWDHPDELLHCLCRAHHIQRQEIEESIKVAMMKRLRRVPISRLNRVFWHILNEALRESEVGV